MAHLIMSTQTQERVCGFRILFSTPWLFFFFFFLEVTKLDWGMCCFKIHIYYLGFGSAGVKMTGCCGC